MSYFVVLPGALVPASIAPRLLARANAPTLARRFKQARLAPLETLPTDGAAHQLWLWQRFGGAGNHPVTAPYAWRALNRASATDVTFDVPLWQSDPVHFAFARDHMLVARLEGEAAITPDESRALAEAASTIAADFGATLRVIATTHWFLAFDPAWSIETVGIDAATGRSVEHVWPVGAAAPRWRKLLTEIQMHWHQHPVNERRDAVGIPMINGLWLHGGGTWQPLPQHPFDAIVTDDATVRGWALAAGAAPSALLDGPAQLPGELAGTVLVYEPALMQPAGREDWDAWLGALDRCDALLENLCARAFASGHEAVTFVLAGRQHVRCVVARRADRWAFWRNNVIGDCFAEREAA
jgi:hypothetical protein